MKSRALVHAIAAVATIAACHHNPTPTAPQPDWKSRPPRAMASRIPASPGVRPIMPAGWVLFDFDSDELTPAAKQDLGTASAWLRQHKDDHVIVEGHTDAVGSSHYNELLSFRRGVAVSTFLVLNGVGPDRIEIRPLGKRGAALPALPGDRNAILYARDRR